MNLTAASAQPAPDLYRAKAVVTGTGEKNRMPGFREAFERVLVKVSGDPRLIGDPRAAAMGRDAAGFVDGFRYRDRLEGKPINDEQGTYDRPHDLTVEFNPAKIDSALRSLGREPWLKPRAPLLLMVGVQRDGKAFTVVSQGERDADMRSAVTAAADEISMTALLPDAAALSSLGLSPDSFPEPDPAALIAAAEKLGTGSPLVGTLVWSDEALGWVADWTTGTAGKLTRWQVRGVSFDDAFRNGLRGAMQVQSGNGQPDNGSR